MGITPKVPTTNPDDTKPEERASSIISPESLVSFPMRTAPPSNIDAMAVPTFWANNGVISTFAMPLIPDEPNSFIDNASWERTFEGGLYS